ncbi:cardioactive peptide-like [Oppia nitens]|uniref:cardioactive peptide-like n=1 Tax=Oppia nitens TaxID=1686743 RepID=UPI0023DBCB7C|nr:cardioactive peptide-like [Oppia nitens]
MNFHNGLVIVILVMFSVIIISVSSKIINKRDTESQLDNQNGYLGSIEKRPFCNAFTGCGKKRASLGFESTDSRDPLSRLSQRIINEAKQWELLQNKINNNQIRPDYPLLDYMSSRKRRSIDS